MMCQKLYDIQNIVNELEKDTEGIRLLCEMLEDYLHETKCGKGSLIIRVLSINLQQLRIKEGKVFDAIDAYILEEKKISLP